MIKETNNNLILFVIFISITTLSSCKSDVTKVLTAVTDRILAPVTFEMSPDPDLGEISVGEDPTLITMKVVNNSSDRIQKINLVIDNTQSLLKFKENKNGDVASPGFGGTCGSSLAPNGQCLFILSFNPRKSGTFEIPVTLKYENLIEPQEKIITIKALTGEPASLVFTNDISSYDLGVIEQTDTKKNYLDIEVINSGELSARSVSVNLANANAIGAFSLESHNCPTFIKAKEKCQLRMSYSPKNNDYNDPLVGYKSQLSISYVNDSKGSTGNLNNYAEFISTTIEAKFKENFKIIDFATVYSGNKLTKTVKITNVGYNAGVLQEFIFTDHANNPITTCIKSSGTLLDCNKSLDQFPFVIEDVNECFGNQTKGIEGKLQGASCVFNMTYWPSTKWEAGSQAINYFNDVNVALKYDSQWKNQSLILVKNEMFTILADFLSVGKIQFSSISLESIPIIDSKIIHTENNSLVDLERIALVSSDIYSKFFKVTWTNVGENTVTVDKISDKHMPTANLITTSGKNLNAFYKNIKSGVGCDIILPGASCSFSFDLAPVLQANPATEDLLMYDDISDLNKKIKTFSIHYNDGSLFEDDGSSSTKKHHNVNLTSKLIKKGLLAFTGPLNSSSNLINGSSDVKNLCLTNVGTGEVYAIKSHATENLYPNGADHWPFKIIDLAVVTSSCPSPATKDCHDIIFKSDDLLPMVADPSKFLDIGETCVLSYEVKIAETIRENISLPTEEHNRPFGPGLSNTSEAWPRRSFAVGPIPVSFSYYDGDYVSTDSASYPNYGYSGITKKSLLNVAFRSPAQLNIVNPLPATSAVIHRPSLTYPLISSTYPTIKELSSITIPEMYFPGSYFSGSSNGFTKSDESYIHVDTLNLKNGIYDNEFKIHIGTFTVNDVISASVDIKNTGGSSALNVVFSEDVAPSPIEIEEYGGFTVKPFPDLNINTGLTKIVKIKFRPTSPGLFKHCFDLDYDNQLLTTSQHVCIYAEAVSVGPKIKIEYSDIEVNMPGPIETPTGIYTNVNAPINSSDGTSIIFSGIKDSSVYVKKIIRFTNTGLIGARKFNYFYMPSTTSAAGTVPGDTSLIGAPIKGCVANMTLAAADYCEIIIKYQPIKSSSSALNRFLGVIYEINPNSSQYVSQVAGLNFSSFDPAKLSVVGASPESLNDWSNPANPLPVSESWPIDLTAYSKKNQTHLVLDSHPQNKTFSSIVVKNETGLKASLLYMNPNPAPGVWNVIYTNSFITVSANRYCFYGDDESNNSVPANEKGFNNISINPCVLKAEFTGHQTYTSCSAWSAPTKSKEVLIGELVQATCNPYVFKLEYFNNKRSSYTGIYFHLKGFIEPNKSTTDLAPAEFSNISSTFVSGSVGRVSFTWPELIPTNADWGDIIKYRVYYDLLASNLNSSKVFKKTGGPAFIDTPDPLIRNITISNLVVGKFYYFKVMAIRSYTGINYLSDNNLPLLTLPIPASDYTYHHESRSLVDKTYLPTPGDRTVGVTECSKKFYNIAINGGTIKHNKTLITTPIWQYLINTPTANLGYPGSGIGTIPHWLGDAEYDLRFNISLYDGTELPGFPNYVTTSMSGNNPENKILYQKTCNNITSCNKLYKIVGGDDYDLYYNGVYYAKEKSATSYFRCRAVMKCPTSTSKLITSPTCVAP